MYVCIHTYIHTYMHRFFQARVSANGDVNVDEDDESSGGFTITKVLALLVQKSLLTSTKVLAYWYKSSTYTHSAYNI